MSSHQLAFYLFVLLLSSVLWAQRIDFEKDGHSLFAQLIAECEDSESTCQMNSEQFGSFVFNTVDLAQHFAKDTPFEHQDLEDAFTIMKLMAKCQEAKDVRKFMKKRGIETIRLIERAFRVMSQVPSEEREGWMHESLAPPPFLTKQKIFQKEDEL